MLAFLQDVVMRVEGDQMWALLGSLDDPNHLEWPGGPAGSRPTWEGTTLVDWIVEIIERHGPGGSESEDNVVLRLL